MKNGEKIMKKTIISVIFIVCIFMCIESCEKKTYNNQNEDKDLNSDDMITYNLSDFNYIKIGKTTMNDIIQKPYGNELAVTSYGFICKYALTNGEFLEIGFEHSNLTVIWMNHNTGDGSVC